ncbi:MAG: hypothetical protein ACQES5_11305, partial [Thermodesulfobacteriota bacterium]
MRLPAAVFSEGSRVRFHPGEPPSAANYIGGDFFDSGRHHLSTCRYLTILLHGMVHALVCDRHNPSIVIRKFIRRLIMIVKSMLVTLFSFFLFFAPEANAADKYEEDHKFKDVEIELDNGDTVKKDFYCKIKSNSWENENFELTIKTGNIEKSCTCIEKESWFLDLNKATSTPYECTCTPETPDGVKDYRWLKLHSRRATCDYFIGE